MRLKIISDGYTAGTKIVNLDTGEPIMGVQKIKWSVDATTHLATAKITIVNIAAEIDVYDAEEDLD